LASFFTERKPVTFNEVCHLRLSATPVLLIRKA
jgi:hypothetical protein